MGKGNNTTNKKSAPVSNNGGAKTGSAEKRRIGATEIFLIVFAAVALIAIVAGIVIGVITSSNKGRRVDYYNDDLSKYVYISENDYKSFTAEVNVDPVDDYDVENAILKLLCSKKTKTPEYNGIYLKNMTVTPGDVVKIYYRGYTLDENGKKVDFQGGCNFSGDPTELEIGSGSFVAGFELGLVDRNAKNYSTFKRYNSTGAIGAEDKVFVVYRRGIDDGSGFISGAKVVNLALGRDAIDKEYGTGFYTKIVGQQYGKNLNFDVETDNGKEKYEAAVYHTTGVGDLFELTYSALYHDGTVAQSQTAMIDLSDPTLDDKWGDGFREYFELGVPVGTQVVNSSNQSATLNLEVGDGGVNSYYNMTVSYIYDVGDSPLTVDAYFPTDYANSKELQGVHAKFDVYIEASQIYTAPQYNDAFIRDVLKLTEEDLKSYAGDTLEDKYKSKVRIDLEKTYQDSVNSVIDSAFLQHILDKVEVKKLPKNDVRAYYDSYYNDILTQYSSYSSYYNSLDAFAREYMQLSSTADWKAEIQSTAEKTVAQKLAFYYIIRQEGLVISDEDYNARYTELFEQYLNSYLANVNCVRENYESDEEYEKAKEGHTASVKNYYTDEYFRETIVYEYALKELRKGAKIQSTK